MQSQTLHSHCWGLMPGDGPGNRNQMEREKVLEYWGFLWGGCMLDYKIDIRIRILL